MTVERAPGATDSPGNTLSDRFWLGDALGVGREGLELDGVPLLPLAREHGTPTYVYGVRTLRRRVGELRAALATAGAPFKIHYALKAARFERVLATLRAEGDVGIDACSPREVDLAISSGFAPEEISVTVSMPSDRDLSRFAAAGVHLNLDSRSALRRWAAARRPSSPPGVGLRVNPMVRVGWGDDPKLAYGGGKFGFDPDAVLDAAAYAHSLGLRVDELHVHAGWGIQSSAAPALGRTFALLAQIARGIPTLRAFNVGGGLCVRQRAEDDPLRPEQWAGLIREHLAPAGLTVKCEPGTFIAAPSGVLLAEVNTVEPRASGTWVGIDAGHNVNCYAAHYGIPHAVIHVARPLDPPAAPVHLAGNINEANDVFARGLRLPEVREGDVLALYPAGAYGASMASDHCMRGGAAEVMV